MKEKVEVITYLEGLRIDYDEYYASISNSKHTFSLFQPERLSEKTSKEDAIV